MTTRESLKNYCEAHKKEIIIGTVCLLIGVSYGKAKYGVRKKEMNFIKDFRRFKTDPVSGRKAIESLTKVQDGSNGSSYFFTPKPGTSVNDVMKWMTENYGAKADIIETTGVVVFEK